MNILLIEGTTNLFPDFDTVIYTLEIMDSNGLYAEVICNNEDKEICVEKKINVRLKIETIFSKKPIYTKTQEFIFEEGSKHGLFTKIDRKLIKVHNYNSYIKLNIFLILITPFLITYQFIFYGLLFAILTLIIMLIATFITKSHITNEKITYIIETEGNCIELKTYEIRTK